MTEPTPSPTRLAKATDAPKRFPVVHFKALGDDEAPGTFEALVGVFGNIDSVGDRVLPGAFVDTLKAPPEGKGIPPEVWSHDWMTPPIGVGLEAREVSREEAEDLAGKRLPDDVTGGLYKKTRLFVADDEDVPLARHVWTAMRAKGGDGLPPLREFSFAYKTRAYQWVKVDVNELPPHLAWTGGEIRELSKLDLNETGPTLRGANPATELIAIKSSIAALEERGLLPSDEARKMLREVGDNPAPNAPARAKSSPAVAEEARARIAELSDLRPPAAL